MPLEDTIYCAQQINIPSELPELLKQYTKAAIRTQPKDIVQWSAAYFSALSSGDTLPVKRRLEPFSSDGITMGNLEVLVQQYKGQDMEITKKDLEQKWVDLGLPKEQLAEFCITGSFGDVLKFDNFTGVACLHIGQQISEALKLICQLLSNDPPGYAERIEYQRFADIYTFLAGLSGIPSAQTEMVLQYLNQEAEKQGGMVMPRNLATSECPSLG